MPEKPQVGSPPHPHAHAHANGISKRRFKSPASPTTLLSSQSPQDCSDWRLLTTSLLDDYGKDILAHMSNLEEETSPNVEMMDMQPELEWYMRPYLIDFLVEVHAQFKMLPQTLQLAVNLVDRYTSRRVVFKKHFQLVGCAALLIASKFEDSKDHVPTVRELRQMCCNAYDEDMFVQMEGHVLTTLGWAVGFPGPEQFLQIICAKLGMYRNNGDAYSNTLKTAQELQQQIHLARYFLDLALFHREFLSIPSSTQAASAMTLARHILGVDKYGMPKEAMLDSVHTSQISLVINLFLEKLPIVSDILAKKYAEERYSHVSQMAATYLSELVVPTSHIEGLLTPQRSVRSSEESECILRQQKRQQQQQQQRERGITTPPPTPIAMAKNSAHVRQHSGLPTPPCDESVLSDF